MKTDDKNERPAPPSRQNRHEQPDGHPNGQADRHRREPARGRPDEQTARSSPEQPQSPIRARLGLPRLLIVGCGDVGKRLLPMLRGRYRIFAVTSQEQNMAALRAAGAVPVLADLDDCASLARLGRLAHTVIHLAPPQGEGALDRRTRRLAGILPDAARLVYVSTTGVYGDCAGARFGETRPVSPDNARAVRRVDAENVLRAWARRANGSLSILRVPGIYAGDRLPLARLDKGLPALLPDEDVYTNHIHADDLARIVVAALARARPQRVYHAVDDSDMKMGDYFDAVADAFGRARAPRLTRAELERQVSPAMLTFMSESRRLRNDRIKGELGVRLRFSSVADGLRQAVADAQADADTAAETGALS